MPPGFDPNLYFGEDNDESDDDEEGYQEGCDESQQCQKKDKMIVSSHGSKTEIIPSNEGGTTAMKQQSKLKLLTSWEEKQQLLFRIYDEGEFPAELLE